MKIEDTGQQKKRKKYVRKLATYRDKFGEKIKVMLMRILLEEYRGENHSNSNIGDQQVMVNKSLESKKKFGHRFTKLHPPPSKY